jgi:hypothetical protein
MEREIVFPKHESLILMQMEYYLINNLFESKNIYSEIAIRKLGIKNNFQMRGK